MRPKFYVTLRFRTFTPVLARPSTILEIVAFSICGVAPGSPDKLFFRPDTNQSPGIVGARLVFSRYQCTQNNGGRTNQFTPTCKAGGERRIINTFPILPKPLDFITTSQFLSLAKMVDFSFPWSAAFVILFGVWSKDFFCDAVETFASRSYFYVGGHYENTVSSPRSRCQICSC